MKGFSLRRLAAIFFKEFVQMRRDRLTFAMMVAVPVMQLLLFGYAINTDPRHMATVVELREDGPHHVLRPNRQGRIGRLPGGVGAVEGRPGRHLRVRSRRGSEPSCRRRTRQRALSPARTPGGRRHYLQTRRQEWRESRRHGRPLIGLDSFQGPHAVPERHLTARGPSRGIAGRLLHGNRGAGPTSGPNVP